VQERTPENAEYYKLRRDCHNKMNESKKALMDFKKMVELAPQNLEDRELLIRTLFDRKRFDEAVEGENISILALTTMYSLNVQPSPAGPGKKISARVGANWFIRLPRGGRARIMSVGKVLKQLSTVI
jgi:hypothetical protein